MKGNVFFSLLPRTYLTLASSTMSFIRIWGARQLMGPNNGFANICLSGLTLAPRVRGMASRIGSQLVHTIVILSLREGTYIYVSRNKSHDRSYRYFHGNRFQRKYMEM